MSIVQVSALSEPHMTAAGADDISSGPNQADGEPSARPSQCTLVTKRGARMVRYRPRYR
jgi:hypothetical protein